MIIIKKHNIPAPRFVQTKRRMGCDVLEQAVPPSSHLPSNFPPPLLLQPPPPPPPSSNYHFFFFFFSRMQSGNGTLFNFLFFSTKLVSSLLQIFLVSSYYPIRKQTLTFLILSNAKQQNILLVRDFVLMLFQIYQFIRPLLLNQTWIQTGTWSQPTHILVKLKNA